LGGTTERGLWSVGYRRTAKTVEPLVTRRPQSGRWQPLGAADGVPRNGFLTDVAGDGSGAAWAVGYRLRGLGRHHPLAIRWDGRRWTKRNPGLRPGETGSLSGVSVTPQAGTWIAGSVTKGGLQRPYIAKRSRGRWQRASLPQVGEAALASIKVTSRSSGWAVGYRLGKDGETPLVMRWDGAAWRVVELRLEWEGPAILMDVDVAASGVVAIAGSAWTRGRDTQARNGRMRGLVLRLEDGEWSRHLLRSPHDVALTGVDGDPSGLGWATGGDLRVGYLAKTCDPALRSGEWSAGSRRGATGDDATAARQAPATAAPRVAPTVRIGSTGDLKVVDRAGAVGLPAESVTWGAVIADFDADGQQDIFLGRHGSRARLFLDQGDTFTASDLELGWGDRHGCAADDVDDSGLPDLYCSFGGDRGRGVHANELWLDPGGAEPRLEPVSGGAVEPLGRGRKVAFVDIDADGHNDLLLGQRPNRVDGLPSVTRAYLRDGVASFRALESSGIDRGLGTLSLDVADFDLDGRADVALVFDQQRANGPGSGIRLYRNTDAGFREVSRAWGVRSMRDRDAELVRLDGDEHPDLVQLSADKVRVSVQRDGRFKRAFERGVSNAVAVAAGDVDGDGDQDLYILRDKTTRRTKDLVLLNDGTGASFDAIKMPSRPGGKADDVFPIDHDSNGLMDFLALNGRGASAGPVQLLSFYR
jgi:hypothetical protein